MSCDLIPSCWILVIDTDSYSGNFERELTAYLTGQLGECGVGKNMADLFEKDAKTSKPPADFCDLVINQSDDKGCYRPCTIWPTPGWYNDGKGNHHQRPPGKQPKRGQYPAYQSVAIFFEKRPSDNVIAWLKKRAEGYEAARKAAYDWNRGEAPKILGWRLIRHEIVVNDYEEKI